MKSLLKRSFLILLVNSLFFFTTRAATFQTITSGDWNDPAIWDLGAVPGVNDDIIILHEVSLSSNINITDGSLTILETGELNFTGQIQASGNSVFRNTGIIRGKDIVVQGSSTFTNTAYSNIETANTATNATIENFGVLKITMTLGNTGTVINHNVLDAIGVVNNGGNLDLRSGSKTYVYSNFDNTGNISLCGAIALANQSSAGQTFANRGVINGCNGGIFVNNPNTNITNLAVGSITGTANLCLVEGNFTNNGTGDFTYSCCFLLTANAGKSRKVCSGDWVTIGGNPTAEFGQEPYTYVWTSTPPDPNITDVNAANPQVLPATETTYTVTVTDNNGCTAIDQVILTPVTSVIANVDRNFEVICEGESVTLGGSPSAHCGTPPYNITWTPNIYLDNANSANPIATPPVTTRYKMEVTDNGSTTTEAYTTVIVNTPPTPANAGPDQDLCNVLVTTMDANTPAVGHGRWFVVSGPVTIANPFNPNTAVTGLTPGSTSVLKWVTRNESCSSEDEVTIHVDEPVIANPGLDQDLCNATSTTLNANAPTFGSGQWSIVSGPGSFADAMDRQTQINGLVPGSNTVLEWTITNGSCVHSEQITINNSALPTTAAAGDDQNLCNVTTTTMAANAPSDGTGNWLLVTGTATIDNPSDPTTTISNLVPGGTPTTLRWVISNGSCTNSFDDVVLTASLEPAAIDIGTDQNLCPVTTATVTRNSTLTVGTGSWSISSGPGTIVSPTATATTINDLVPGSNTVVRYTVTNGACTKFEEITLNVSPEPTVSNAGADQTLCNATSTNLNGNSPTVGTGVWTLVAGTATIDDPNNPNSLITGLGAGNTVTLRWTINLSGCSIFSQDDVVINVVDEPSAADAGPDQTLCNVTTTTLAGNIPTSGTGAWSIVSGSGTINDPTASNSALSNLVPGTTTILRWTISRPECTVTSEDDVTITVNANPTQADAGADQILCSVNQATLAGNTPTFGIGSWSVVSGSGTISDPSDPNTTVTNLAAGTSITLRWTITDVVCSASSTDDVIIQLLEDPTTANAGADQTLCQGTTRTTLEANNAVIGNGTWSLVSGNATIHDPTNPNSIVSALSDGTSVTLRWTIQNNICAPSVDEVTIDVLAAPGLDVRTAEICQGQYVQLNASGGTRYSWAPAPGLSATDIANPIASPDVTTTYTVTIENTGCPSVQLDATITVLPAPIVDISPDTTIIIGETIQLTASGGTSYSWSPIEGLNDPNISNPLATPLETMTYTVLVANDRNCESSASVTVSIDDRNEIFVPDMFTPNGDGMNDMLFVNAFGLDKIEFKVFNRSGKLIFETSDPQRGWDGTFNGIEQEIDTYVYFVKAQTFGRSNITRKGTVKLVR
ncbi:gliding motility-associated C-terminal domain-containing protein [Fulvivirgaceae bacterium BMA10]|uniref:Gliding motility-associated C-terminal domain-containing protein n=1 Tax=Splendidivirga corallicola TaxID=3051826 RepID=A0ABT8KSV1_9BACT|nr:gliding motility-associated C-terminal domain-containing protein [Fulvivirgaceae bacterium BMA10]